VKDDDRRVHLDQSPDRIAPGIILRRAISGGLAVSLAVREEPEGRIAMMTIWDS